MKIETHHSQNAPAAIGPYVQAKSVQFQNGLIFCSGQIALDKDGNDFTSLSVAEQTEIAMNNMVEVLKAAQSSIENILKVTIYLVDMDDFTAVNEVYGKFFKTNPPARATVAVAGLPKGALVEIDCIAAK